MIRLRIAFLWIATIIAIQLSIGASSAFAQHYVSVYLDGDANESTLYGYVDTADSSSDIECGHSGAWTSGYISGPTGSGSNGQSGFSTTVTVATGEGTFTLDGFLTLNCGCGSPVSDGDSTNLSIKNTYFQLPTYIGNGFCRYDQFACSSGFATCGDTPHYVLQGSSVCPSYVRVLFLEHAGDCTPVGGAIPWGGPGACT